MQFTTPTIIAFLATLSAASPLARASVPLYTLPLPITNSGLIGRAASIPAACHFVNSDASSHNLICTYASAPIIDSNFPGTCTTSANGNIDCMLPEGAKDVSIATPLEARAVEQEAYVLHISWKGKRDAGAVMERAVEQEAYVLHISWKAKRDVMERAVEQEAYVLHISW